MFNGKITTYPMLMNIIIELVLPLIEEELLQRYDIVFAAVSLAMVKLRLSASRTAPLSVLVFERERGASAFHI